MSPQAPQVGDAFAVPLADGRFGACRVISMSDEHPVVAALDWIGERAPTLAEAAGAPVLKLQSFSWAGDRCIRVIMLGKPAAYRKIGAIEPGFLEKRYQARSYTRWDSIPLHILNEWRWRHDREALVAEVEAERLAARERLQKQEAEELASISFATVRSPRLFRSWNKAHPRRVVAAVRRVFGETADALEGLGPAGTEDAKIAILKACIARLNALDAEHGHFIETREREDLMKQFGFLLHLIGLGDKADLADGWREW